MSFQWDSLRAHTGCLKLFDLRDLTSQIRRLQLRHEAATAAQAAASDQPRQFRFQRLTPAMLAERRAQQQQDALAAAAAQASSSSSTTSTTPRLPPLVTEDETTAGTYLASGEGLGGGRRFPGRGRTLLGENGLVVFVQEDAKIRVMRDRRTKEDLLQVRAGVGGWVGVCR